MVDDIPENIDILKHWINELIAYLNDFLWFLG